MIAARGGALERLVAGLAIATLWTPSLASAACTPARSPADAPVALVLSGGGAKGAWEAGVAAALVEGGLRIRLVAGSSAGALNAAMLADGRLDRLESAWRDLRREQVWALRPSVFFSGFLPGWLTLLAVSGAGSLLDPQPLRDLIAASLDLDRIRASPVRLLVVATDLVRRETRRFDNWTVTVDALMAATAVPGVFPPVEIDGDLLVDGGLTSRAPIVEALDAGLSIGRAIVLVSYAPEGRGDRPATVRRALEDAFEIAMRHQILRDTELARLRHPGVEIQIVTPSVALGLRPLDFDPARLARALEGGRADGTACLKAWEGGDGAR
ncbi:MAG: patatin-like phospholipase family protein [Candidatus Rokubacteria bacterium]|nr:patatin-like phospholipase family protein [Candidatus Rokubacteria bacterium]